MLGIKGWKWVCLGVTLPLAAGCGYQLRGTGEPVGLEIRSLAIPMIESPSSQLGFEGDFTRIIREEFISHAKVPLASREKAHAVLLGKVSRVWTEPLSYKTTRTIVEGKEATFSETSARRLVVRLQVQLLDRTTGKIVWQDDAMEEKASFAFTADPLENDYNQRIALEEVARRLAERIYQNTMERF